jgi:hypothetical protein
MKEVREDDLLFSPPLSFFHCSWSRLSLWFFFSFILTNSVLLNKYEDYNAMNTFHVDAFLYEDDESVDYLEQKGVVHRNYCLDCGSHNICPTSKQQTLCQNHTNCLSVFVLIFLIFYFGSDVSRFYHTFNISNSSCLSFSTHSSFEFGG